MAPHYLSKQHDKVATFKIYLSNLPDSLQNEELKSLFEEFGRTVECEVFKKNYAFVHMEEESCGREAVNGLNRREIDGKVIAVSVSKNLEPPNVAGTKLAVKNLPSNMNAIGLRKLFQKYGLVLEAEISKTGEATVTMEATGDIRTAINEISAMELEGKKLLVDPVKVNLKAERFGQFPPQMEWKPKPPSAAYAQPSYYRQDHRPPPPAHGQYALGGGYSAQAQAEEFYGHPEEEYYEEEEEEEQLYFEEEYYPASVYPPPEYESYEPEPLPPPPVRHYGMVPGPAQPRIRPQHPFPPAHGRGHPILRPGVDFVRRGDPEYYEDEPVDSGYGVMPLPPPVRRYGMMPPHVVLRNPPVHPHHPPGLGLPARGATRGVGLRGRGGPRGRGGRGHGVPPRPPMIPIPKRKVVRGEPYPVPPVPPARMLLGGRGWPRPRAPAPMRGGPAGVGPVGPIRPKSRGERGGKNTLTAGKLAKLRELAESGVRVPGTLEGRMELISQYGFTPLDPKSRKEGNLLETNIPKISGGAPGLLAQGRAAQAALNAFTPLTMSMGSYSRSASASDPFGPSAVETRYYNKIGLKPIADEDDFTADIMLT